MIATVSLLTPSGLGHFYAVFEDYESMTDVNRDLTLFLDPQVLPYDGEKVKAKRGWEKKRKLQYEEWLTKISWLSTKKFLPWAKPEISAAKISSVKRDAAERNGKDSHPAGREEDLWKLADLGD
ncbi:hypothetical protein K4K56_011840 [Colletotrichum sp. SAR 10_98]|nr:hypothetical protein K4K56_011840 [Colletotrichum sp. SAR 10_98]